MISVIHGISPSQESNRVIYLYWPNINEDIYNTYFEFLTARISLSILDHIIEFFRIWTYFCFFMIRLERWDVVNNFRSKQNLLILLINYRSPGTAHSSILFFSDVCRVEGLRAMVTMLGPHRMLSSSAGVHCRVGEVSPGPRLSGGQCWVSICRVWAGEFYPLTTTENCSV